EQPRNRPQRQAPRRVAEVQPRHPLVAPVGPRRDPGDVARRKDARAPAHKEDGETEGRRAEVRRSPGEHGAEHTQVERMKSTTIAASSSPLSSWRKWPAPVTVTPRAPGMAMRRRTSPPRVMGSPSEN